ncbi:MAG: hypothetical protein DMD89_05785 [Candidatus Rokuibacteriota bacterium]|nr:MAG: hypothetical protein DMD89_05785 [Candidatus Rokubacteria bacterium]
MSVMRRGLFATLLLGGCATTGSHEHAAHMDVYWSAARECERRNLTVHVERVFPTGDVAIFTDQDTRIEVSRFVTCYHETIQRNVEAFRRAGRPLPEPLNLHPEVDLD